MTAPAIPFFRAGAGEGATVPLGIISGGLIFDSGEADQTFLFRCQDRFLVYNALASVRTVLFVSSERHWRRYCELLDGLNARLRQVSVRTGLDLPTILQPLFVPLDAETLAIDDAPFLRAQLCDPGIRDSLARGEIVFNQLSPTIARLVAELAAVLERCGVTPAIDQSRLRAQAELAVWCHDKAHYVDLVAASAASLPPHARTAVIDVDELLACREWRDLAAIYMRRARAPEPTTLYVKSSFDSGGNVARRIAPVNARENIEALHRDVLCQVLWHPAGHLERLRALQQDIGLAPSMDGLSTDERALTRYLETQAARRRGVRFLVQEAIEGEETRAVHGCEGLGVTCVLGGGRADVSAVAGQLYRDRERHHFLGSFLGNERNGLAVETAVREQIGALCGEYLRRGYEGPLNFDARRDRGGRWVFIYDCNPRLSAVYPAMAVRAYLGTARADTVVSLGYRGEFAVRDVDTLMAALSAHGLLYSAARGSGALPLPSLAREGGCDFALVNLAREEIDRFILSPVVPERDRSRHQVF